MAIVGLTIVSLFGVRVSKWLQNIGGTAQILTFSALILVPFIALSRGTASNYHPLAVAMPSVTLLSLNIFGKMALGALSGFEYVAILAGECRNPARSIGRATMAAVPIIALMFILGTSSVLGLVPQDQIDLVSPIPQTLGIGFAGLGVARFIVPVLIMLLLSRQIGQRGADLRRQHAAADGRRLGRPAAGLVLAPASEVSTRHTTRSSSWAR